MERLNKKHEKYNYKDFHESNGFWAYSFKENDISRKKPLPNLSSKVYYGGGASCQYEVVVKLKIVDSVLERQFNDLATKWEDDTGLYSTITPKVVNNAFYDLLLLGRDEGIITLILKRLQNGAPAQWHIVLNAITKKNPVPAEYISKSRIIKESWISWGKKEGYLI